MMDAVPLVAAEPSSDGEAELGFLVAVVIRDFEVCR